jgi:hypothetical protein
MSDFGETIELIGRKDHRCIACYEPIPKGESHKYFHGKWSGDWQDWRMHNECYNAMDDDDLNDGFCPGEHPRPEVIHG